LLLYVKKDNISKSIENADYYQVINFICDNEEYGAIVIKKNSAFGTKAYDWDATPAGWEDDKYKTIEITSVYSDDNKDFVNWLKNNAIRQ
jgi:hypothetical protein